MIRLLATALLVLAQALPAGALSCLRPDPLATLRTAQDAAEPYVILYGTLDFDTALMPPYLSGVPIETPEPVAATFSGRALGRGGFSYIVSENPITLVPECDANWCGITEPATPSLIFAEVTEQGWRVTHGACPFWVYLNPPRAILDSIATCATGGSCTMP